jgi:hypothetical protein
MTFAALTKLPLSLGLEEEEREERRKEERRGELECCMI